MAILRKIIKLTGDIWTILGIALLMLVVTEVGLSLAFYIRSFWHIPNADFRIKADTYADRSWAAQYYKEIDEMERGRSMRWKSYVYWRRMARTGKYININSDGLRQTNGATKSEGAVKVFMFGGSTMWGMGAGDDFTIPSIFGREAKKRGIGCDVVNFGQYAYVSAQEVIELMLQLQKGNIPDVVVFYDGFNDTFTAFQLGVPGLPWDEIRREKEFNLLERKELKALAAQSAIRQLSTVRFLNGVLKTLGLRRENIQPIPLEYEAQISDRRALARAVVETYLGNIRLVQALSESYGFKCLFYWQPVIYLKRHLTDYERKSIEPDFNYPGMKELYLETYAFLQERTTGLKNEVAFHNISPIFNDVHEPIYVDSVHLGDKGNSFIAQRMADDFVRLSKVECGQRSGRLRRFPEAEEETFTPSILFRHEKERCSSVLDRNAEVGFPKKP